MTTQHDRLDKHIAGAAEYDEMLTAGVVEEPRRSNADRMTPAQMQDKWDRLGGLHVP